MPTIPTPESRESFTGDIQQAREIVEALISVRVAESENGYLLIEDLARAIRDAFNDGALAGMALVREQQERRWVDF